MWGRPNGRQRQLGWPECGSKLRFQEMGFGGSDTTLDSHSRGSMAEHLLQLLDDAALQRGGVTPEWLRVALQALPGVADVRLLSAEMSMPDALLLALESPIGGSKTLALQLAEGADVAAIRKGMTVVNELLRQQARVQRLQLQQQQQTRFHEVFENSPDPCWLMEAGRFVDCNRAALDMFGYDRWERFPDNPAAISPPLQPDGRSSQEKAQEMVNKALLNGVNRFEWLHLRADGSLFPTEITLAKIHLDGRDALYCVGRDISERKRMEERAHDLAYFDPLTHLPNRRLLHDRLVQSVATCAHSDSHCALLYLDLDHFKAINELQSHALGDRVLVEVAARLLGVVRNGDTVARMGGDEFVILLQQLDAAPERAVTQAQRVAEKVLAALAQPCLLDGVTCTIGASLGLATFNDDGVQPDELLRRAESAMYQAKAAGRRTARFYDPNVQACLNARTLLEVELQQAVERGEFVLHLQPQVDAEGRCVGAEALVRWNHPLRGMVPPGEFIPIAEETGLIVPMGRWVLEDACRILADWQHEPRLAELSLAVNVSARQFYQPDFVPMVQALIAQTGVNAERLKLEITESMLLGNIDQAITNMRALQPLGITFSLDDFGTGYSSLSYVKRLPLKQIKIDRSFVREIETDDSDIAICRAIIAMGHSLGMEIMAEGVETQAQWACLAREGCDQAQGYLYARPMPEAGFRVWVGAQ